jgi:hypothetical protein
MTFILSDKCLSSPTRYDVAAIEFLMLWPDDPDVRQAAMNAVLLEEGRAFVDDMDVDTVRDYAKLALSSPRLSQVQSTIGDRHRHGMFAGRVALQAIFLNNAGLTTSLRQIRQKLADDMKVQTAGSTGYQIEPQTLANKDGPVAKFRPVTHFWAAHAWQRINGDKAFPCRRQNVDPFLGLAEAIRQLGEKTKTPHSKTPILIPGEAVQLPTGIKPTKVVVDFKVVSNTEM